MLIKIGRLETTNRCEFQSPLGALDKGVGCVRQNAPFFGKSFILVDEGEDDASPTHPTSSDDIAQPGQELLRAAFLNFMLRGYV